MKTVKFYNKTTGRWEPIAGISTLGGVSDYNDLSNKPDLSVYALKSELEALREELTNLINSQEPDSQYYTEYTIDNSVSTFSLRSVDNPINNGQYIPQFSGGYDYIKLTLTNGNVTTNLNTSASEVEKIRIYYPAGTTYVKFTDTKVKDVEYIQCGNFTDVREMFKGCSSLEHADLSTLDSSKVQVDNTMLMGVNTDVQLQFSDEWSYTNRDMGLIKMVDVVMHHYREDGLYENSSIYIKSQYDENPVQYVIRQVDPEDERWRFEPLSLELDASYEIYFEDNGNTGETINACFTGNMDIFFVGALPNSFTESRPEIGGNEEPEEEYITGFTLSTNSINLSMLGDTQTVEIHPNETGRPLNFAVYYPSSNWSVIGWNYNYNYEGGNIGFYLINATQSLQGNVVIKELNSGTTQELYIDASPYVSLTTHYKSTDGDAGQDCLNLYYSDDMGQFYSVDFSGSNSVVESDSYGYFTTIFVKAPQQYNLTLTNNGIEGPMFSEMIYLTDNTEIWISDDSTEIYYENPESGGDEPEEPSQEYITGFSLSTDSVTFTNTDASLIYIQPNEPNKTMNFEFSSDSSVFDSFDCSYSSDEAEGTHYIIIYPESAPTTAYSFNVTVRETYSGTEQTFQVNAEAPGQEYITGFDVEPTEVTISPTSTDLVINIYPFEQGKAINFSAQLVGFSTTNMFNTSEYESGESNTVKLVVWNFSSVTPGNASIIIREENSGHEKQVTVTITE